jgi:pyruvate,water dikinase
MVASIKGNNGDREMKRVQKKKLILKGIGASPGVAKGYARIASNPSEALEKFQKDDILVTFSTDPSWTTCLLKAVAVVTETGGVLSHAAIVSREFGIPCVVGAKKARKVLKDGMRIEVDGTNGFVYYLEEE